MFFLDLTSVHVSAAAAAAFVTLHSKKSAASDCATPPAKKGKTGDDLFDVDSDPDLAPGRFSSPFSMSSTPDWYTCKDGSFWFARCKPDFDADKN